MRDALHHSVRRRLVHGAGAALLSPVVTAVVQFGTVPLLLSAWGVAGYADWLLLSAIPAYLAQSDLGFGDAAASDMTARVAAGDSAGALTTYQSAWSLLTLMSCAVVLIAGVGLQAIPWREWLHLSTIADSEACLVLALFVLGVIAGQQAKIFECGFRSVGRFAEGTAWNNVFRLAEAAAFTVAAVMTNSLVVTAFASAGARIATTVAYGLLLRWRSPWLQLGIRHASRETIRRLASPALAFVALPVGQALSHQGYTTLIGIVLGPAAVVTFSTLRTLTRTNFQILTAVARSVWPELSMALGTGNIALARRLHRTACQAALALSGGGAVLLLFAGPYVYSLWVRGAAPFDATCFHVLLAVTVANSLWYTSMVVPMSANAHAPVAWAYVAVTAASLVLARLLIVPFGLTGAALALLLIDAGLTCFVVRAGLRQVNDTFRQFITAIARPLLPARAGARLV